MKIWSRLTERTQKQYRSKGVTPQRYNAWVKTSQKTKSKLASKGISRNDFLTAKSTKEASRAASEKRAAARLVSVLPKAKEANIRKHVATMTPAELQIAIQARPDKLRSLASRQGYKTVSWSVTPINPFWYR